MQSNKSPVDAVINPSLSQLEKKQEELLVLLKSFEEKRDKLNMIISEKRGAIGVLRVLTSVSQQSQPIQQFQQQPIQQFQQQQQQPMQQFQQAQQPMQQFQQQPMQQQPIQQQPQQSTDNVLIGGNSKSVYRAFSDPAPAPR